MYFNINLIQFFNLIPKFKSWRQKITISSLVQITSLITAPFRLICTINKSYFKIIQAIKTWEERSNLKRNRWLSYIQFDKLINKYEKFVKSSATQMVRNMSKKLKRQMNCDEHVRVWEYTSIIRVLVECFKVSTVSYFSSSIDKRVFKWWEGLDQRFTWRQSVMGNEQVQLTLCVLNYWQCKFGQRE